MTDSKPRTVCELCGASYASLATIFLRICKKRMDLSDRMAVMGLKSTVAKIVQAIQEDHPGSVPQTAIPCL